MDPLTTQDLLCMCADIEDRMACLDGGWRVEVRLSPSETDPDEYAALVFDVGFGTGAPGTRRVTMAGAVHVRLPCGVASRRSDLGTFTLVSYDIGDNWRLEVSRPKAASPQPVVELSTWE
jgi:hypothetical protein